MWGDPMRFMHCLMLSFLFLATSHVHAEISCQDYIIMTREQAQARSLAAAEGDEASLNVLQAIASGGTALDEQMANNHLLLLYIAVEHLHLGGGQEISSTLRDAIQLGLETDQNATSIKTLTQLDQLIQKTLEKLKKEPFSLSEQKFATWGEKLQELLRLPAKLKTIKEAVDREFTPSTLDAYLFAHHGYHMFPEQARYQARVWDGITLNKIEPSQVKLNLREFLTFVIMAMEIEDPIQEYSERTGQTIRFILPKFARFMGSTAERLQYLEENGAGTRWCESAWCKEERRHGNAWARIYQKLTGQDPSRDNPNSIADVEFTEKGAFDHLISRMTTEWNASSTYLTFSHQTDGELHGLMMNITRDEIKHLIISSSAYVFLKGIDPWGRFKDLARTAWYFVTSHQEERSNGQDMITNKVRLIEAVYTHALIELKMRRYLRTLPLSALREIFDGETRIEPKETAHLDEATQRQYAAWEKDAARKRSRLLWWEQGDARDQALAQELFEQTHRQLIDQVIEREFDGFKGDEVFESLESQAQIDRIHRLDIQSEHYPGMDLRKDGEMWIRVLSDALRHYQIFHAEAALKQNPT